MDPSLIAHKFNTYFTEYNKSKTISKCKLTSRNSMLMKPASPEEIKLYIKTLNNTKSTGYDDISTTILKDVENLIAPVLCHIINNCFENEIYPSKLKDAIIKPCFKKKDRDLMTFYRPISLKQQLL